MPNGNPNNPNEKVRALRALGHDQAADDLAMLFEDDAKQEQQAQRGSESPGIPMLSNHVGIDHQAQAEARTVAEALRRSGVNRWMSGGPLIGESERGDRR